MIDFFNVLKNADSTEMFVGFFIGVIITLATLTYVVYWFFSSFYARRIDELQSEGTKAAKELALRKDELRVAEKERDEQKRKAKDRKATLEVQEKEISGLRQDLAAADLSTRAARAGETKYTDLYHTLAAKYNKLGKVATYWKKQAASLDGQAKLFEKLLGQLWDLPVDPASLVPFRPLAKNKAVIIAVINLKGGVGKTTLTANLAVTYAQKKKQRVLAIDLDFQSSLTNLCLSISEEKNLHIGDGHLVDNVFKDRSNGLANRAHKNVVRTREPLLHLLGNSERFAKVEEDAKAQWIMQNTGLDLRCVLRSALHDPIFQDNFDVILIDCPPRWTTGSINAIACCDYVLIPTVLDRVSSEAVPRLLHWLRDLRGTSLDLYGRFAVLGVLGNLANPREKLIAQEQAIWEGLPGKCSTSWQAPIHHFATIIRDKAEFRRAANSREFAALHADLQPMFVKLVQEIEGRRSAHEGG